MVRLISAFTLLLIVIGVVWFLPPGATLIVSELLLIVAFFEYSDLVKPNENQFSKVLGVTAALGVCAVCAMAPSMLPVMLMTVTIGLTTVQLSRQSVKRVLVSTAVILFGVLYLALPIGLMVSLRFDNEPQILFLLLLTVFASDTAQYYGGRQFGRRSLAKTISPNKTIEGAIFGIIAGVMVMWVLGDSWLSQLSPGFLVLFGATIACLGIVGDLFESTLKRVAEVKDSSQLIPGHGGVLDRLDGLLFAAPVYYTVVFFAR